MDIFHDLKEEHHQLESLLRQLKQAAESDARGVLFATWRIFESVLLRHMHYEDDVLLPEFALRNSAESFELRVEHQQIRRVTEELSLAIQRRKLQPTSIDAFIDKVHAHARREEMALYGWAGKAPAKLDSVEHSEREVVDEMRLQLHLFGMNARDSLAPSRKRRRVSLTGFRRTNGPALQRVS